MDQPHRVAFDLAGDTVVGHLYLPQSRTGPVPGLVVAGPMTSVKEKVTGVYSTALAARGFATLAIDHRHYGESGGLPRRSERWDRKVEDVAAGADFLRGHSMVDQGRGLAAVCLGSGHAALRNPAVRALGDVAGYYRDPAEVEAMDPQGFAAKIEQGVAARLAFEAGKAPVLIPAARLTGDPAIASVDTVDCYTRCAAVSNYTNTFAVMSREWFLPFDVHAAGPDLTIPVCMIQSAHALSLHWARRSYSRLGRRGDLIWLKSRGQTDFDDNPALVGPVSTHLADHFPRHLT